MGVDRQVREGVRMQPEAWPPAKVEKRLRETEDSLHSAPCLCPGVRLTQFICQELGAACGSRAAESTYRTW